MTYASSHRKGVSPRVWQTRQYYLNMLYDAIDTFAPDPNANPRDNAANAIIYGIRLVKEAIEADEPKEPPTCPEEAISPTPNDPLASGPGASFDSEVHTQQQLTFTSPT